MTLSHILQGQRLIVLTYIGVPNGKIMSILSCNHECSKVQNWNRNIKISKSPFFLKISKAKIHPNFKIKH
jgi:hypothetical protein